MHKRLATWLVVFGVFAAGFYATYRSQDIIDWWILRDYVPSEQIASIVDETGMNSEGKKLFYVNDPRITDSKEDFNNSCRTNNEVIVLGCHVQGHEIVIYDVNDERLDGIVEVTAAHEMLHEAYERLSSSERDEVDALLESHYDSIKLEDDRLQTTITTYKKRDSTIVNNELHSILGSEKRDLPKRLEDYYSRYFDDRMLVVELAEDYDDAFAIRQDQIDTYDKQLSGLQGDITQLEISIGEQGSSLQSMRNQLESLRSSDPESYNAQVPSFNSAVNSYNKDIASLRKLIDKFNNIVAERNEIALEERELVEAIDSRISEL